MDSTYQDAADLLEGTEAAQHGLDNHSSNGIYVEVSAAEDVHPIDGSSVEMSRMSGSLWDAVSSPERRTLTSVIQKNTQCYEII